MDIQLNTDPWLSIIRPATTKPCVLIRVSGVSNCCVSLSPHGLGCHETEWAHIKRSPRMGISKWHMWLLWQLRRAMYVGALSTRRVLIILWNGGPGRLLLCSPFLLRGRLVAAACWIMHGPRRGWRMLPIYARRSSGLYIYQWKSRALARGGRKP
jgi:hypothetical protein